MSASLLDSLKCLWSAALPQQLDSSCQTYGSVVMVFVIPISASAFPPHTFPHFIPVRRCSVALIDE